MMNRAAQIASGLALVGTLLPALLFFAGRIDLDQMKSWMVAAALLWFVATPVWMERRKER